MCNTFDCFLCAHKYYLIAVEVDLFPAKIADKLALDSVDHLQSSWINGYLDVHPGYERVNLLVTLCKTFYMRLRTVYWDTSLKKAQ